MSGWTFSASRDLGPHITAWIDEGFPLLGIVFDGDTLEPPGSAVPDLHVNIGDSCFEADAIDSWSPQEIIYHFIPSDTCPAVSGEMSYTQSGYKFLGTNGGAVPPNPAFTEP